MWICLNCHTPLENQQPTLVKEIPRGRVEQAIQEPNPLYDPEYQKESVTCAEPTPPGEKPSPEGEKPFFGVGAVLEEGRSALSPDMCCL